MGGIHTVYRKTHNRDIIAAESILVLPSSYRCQDNDDAYRNGGFPEFFHGFYDSRGNGFDAGVLFSNSKWKAFVNTTSSGNVTWGEGRGFNVPHNGKIKIKTYLQGDYLILSILNTQNREIDKCHFYIGPFKHLLQRGAYFNREMTIAVNPNKNGYVTAPKSVFYRNAKFEESMITHVGGRKSKLSYQNSHTDKSGMVDFGTPTHTYKSRVSYNIENGFAVDISSATFNKGIYRI